MKTIIFGLLLLLAASASAADSDSAAPTVGDVPPRYVGRPLSGPDISLDTTGGKVYVISFWASWCGPCRRELPILSNIQRIGGTAKIQVMAVNIEDREVFRKLQPTIVKLGLTPAFDPGRKAQHAYGVNGIPHMIIVGRDGRISAVHRGYDEDALPDIAADLNTALAVEPASATK